MAKKLYRDEVKAELNQSYRVVMMEDYQVSVPLDDKFLPIISGKNLIAAIFVKKGSREGLCWELGFLEGFARGKDVMSTKSVGLLTLQRCVVAWVQHGVESEIIGMVRDGMFTKIEVRPYYTQYDLIEDIRTVCNRKLHADYRKDLWP